LKTNYGNDQRRTQNYEALREALINAVVHRDYFEKGSNVMVEIFEDRIEITNPGGLVKGLSPENFGKISMLRNPGIANLFHRIDYIEKMGTGIERIRLALKEANLPTVQYELNPVYVKAVFPRQAEGWEKTTQETTQEIILQLIKNNPSITRNELSDKTGISPDGVKYHLDLLKKAGIIRHTGPTKKGKWELLKDSKSNP
jgi:ATP-dependent DNA helicase RecG